LTQHAKMSFVVCPIKNHLRCGLPPGNIGSVFAARRDGKRSLGKLKCFSPNRCMPLFSVLQPDVSEGLRCEPEGQQVTSLVFRPCC
jgi:hypothetical protein